LSQREALIADIEQLLNSYEGLNPTHINPALLVCMDEQSLKSVIAALLDQKEKTLDTNREWLQQFKKE